MKEKKMNLICAKELADLLSLSVRTVWRLRSAGKLPKPVELGASIRWKISDIEGWLNMNCDMNRFETTNGDGK